MLLVDLERCLAEYKTNDTSVYIDKAKVTMNANTALSFDAGVHVIRQRSVSNVTRISIMSVFLDSSVE